MAVIIGVLVAILMVADAVLTICLQRQQAEREALEKAEVLADQMRAVWDFIDLNQDVINRNEDGTFRTKTLVCVVAAKSVSTLFTANTDYTIRFTSETPRQNANAPDEFEREAFAAFDNDSDLESYWSVSSDPETGESVFRYVEPLYITETCLECHGEPAGELDQYDYEKEGMQVGDIGGAMSIIEPMDIYNSGISVSVIQQAFMMFVVLILACVSIYIAVNRLILRPVDHLSKIAKRIEQGDFSSMDNPPTKRFKRSDELTEFIHDFERMVGQLNRLYTDLESEVEKQTDNLKELNELLSRQKQELEIALDRLNEESAYKNEFFAIVSHELRTPLTSILAFGRILQENKTLDMKTRSSIIEIEANAMLLLNLVNNILTISKAEANKNELLSEPVDFVDLVGFIHKSLEPIAANKDITLTAKADPDVPVSMADWEKLRRIVENLTDNAIKYTHRGGKVDVRVSFDPDERIEPINPSHSLPPSLDEVTAYETPPNRVSTDKEPAIDKRQAKYKSLTGMSGQTAKMATAGVITIEVTDDGMGIAKEDLPEIFDLYRQASQSPNRRYRGTGLGLAVVKELTELHNGRVTAMSERKHGSTFTVKLPYVPVNEEEDDENSAC